MNKIVVIAFDVKEQALIEEMLYEMVSRGVELFFVATLEHGLEVMEREQPQLIFMDSSLREKVGKRYEERVVFVGEGTTLKRPLQKELVLEVCGRLLDLGSTAPETIAI